MKRYRDVKLFGAGDVDLDKEMEEILERRKLEKIADREDSDFSMNDDEDIEDFPEEPAIEEEDDEN